jgi:dTMP kinase
MKKGRLIVIDGTDGSGKATQVSLLTKHLKKDGYKVKVIDFPDYYGNFFGKFIGHCLTEQYYNFIKVHPKIASVLYAADRFESKEKIDKWLKEGYIVLANRYVSANQIHQGGKIKSAMKREAFIKWLDEMEYKVFFLSLPINLVLKLIASRDNLAKRGYKGKKKDVHESDRSFLENSRASALWLAKTKSYYSKIECGDGNKIRTREDIHNEIYKKVKTLLKN